MKLLFTATLEREYLSGTLVKSTFEAYDNHMLYLTLSPNPDYNKITSPWQDSQKEATWDWDKNKKTIQVKFYDNKVKLWFVEQDLLTKAYLHLLDDLITES